MVSPDNEDVLYFLSFIISKSTDGGKTSKSINGDVHVDHHDIWIDPQNPKRIILGNDGGVYLSFDGGTTWRFLNNLPIGQFYQVACDNSDPYNLGGGLQDNNAWYGTSHNLNGGSITGQNWFVLAGGDGEYVVPAPSDPNIVYAESQNGWLSRTDLRTGISRDLRPYLHDAPDTPPAQLKYRFNWTTPIFVSANDENEVFLGANVLFKTYDGGTHWEIISPDLTRNDKSKQIPSGGRIEFDMSGAENFDTILSIGVSPLDSNVIWVGTDDGLVQLTRDGGKHWMNVTANFPDLPEWGRVYQIEPSPFDRSICYVSVDLHELDNDNPYVFMSSDFGRTWKPISKGLPEGYPVHVIREDPNKQGLLVAGTDNGLFYSSDDGGKWNKFKSNFPAVSVYDLKFVSRTHDLVVATHGRGIFILDNISPLEEFDKNCANEGFHLFSTLPATIFHSWYRDGFNDLSTYGAPNPPEGAMIDYYLKDTIATKNDDADKHESPVRIVVTAKNRVDVATLYGPAQKGFNRFVWNLHYQSALPLVIGNEASKVNPYSTNGPEIPPGKYRISVTVNGKTDTTEISVEPDPRFHTPPEFFTSNSEAGLQNRNEVSKMDELLNRIQNIHDQATTIKKSVESDDVGFKAGKYTVILAQLDSLDKKFQSLKDSMYNKTIQQDVGEDDIHNFSDFRSQLNGIGYAFTNPYQGSPTDVALQSAEALYRRLDDYVRLFNELLEVEVKQFNTEAQGEMVPTLFVGNPIKVKE